MVRSSCLGLAAVLFVTASPVSSQTTAQDQRLRDPGMLWPVGFKPARADSFAHNTLLIHAECGNVYSYLAAVRAWPDWLVFARNVSLVAPATELRAGTKFRWTIFGLPIVSTVFVAESGHRLGWTNQPSGPPPRYAQSWLLKR